MFYWLHAYYYVQSLSGRAAKLDVIEELRTPDLERELHGDESGRSSSETDEKRQRYCHYFVPSYYQICCGITFIIGQRANNNKYVLIGSFNYIISKSF